MSIKYARKRDQSEASIVKALKDAGCDVERGTDCDLYVSTKEYWATVPGGIRFLLPSQAFLLECKTPGPNQKRRQPIQERLQTIFGTQYVVVKDVAEALRAVGIASGEPSV